MKRHIFYLFILLVVTGASFTKDTVFENAISGYIQAIQSDNSGLRHSAIYQIARLKTHYPDKDYSRVEHLLNKVSTSDKVAIIRVHANLVCNYLKSSHIIGTRSGNEDPMFFFNTLHQELNQDFIKDNQRYIRS